MPKAEAQVPEDWRLIEQFLAGDAASFDALFTRHSGNVRSTATRLVGETAAEDVVQETFVHLLHSLDRIDSSFNVRAWIYRIASNLCKDELRRRTRRALKVHHNTDAVDLALLQFPDPDPSGNPEDALERARLREIVWRVSERLPERQRMALTLRELQGLSYASSARVMGISDSALETLLHRARARFKAEFLRMETPLETRSACGLAAIIESLAVGARTSAQERTLSRHVASCLACRQRQEVPTQTATVGPAGVPPLSVHPTRSKAHSTRSAQPRPWLAASASAEA